MIIIVSVFYDVDYRSGCSGKLLDFLTYLRAYLDCLRLKCICLSRQRKNLISQFWNNQNLYTKDIRRPLNLGLLCCFLRSRGSPIQN